MVRKKATSWRQRAKVSWAGEGDCNPTFFHCSVNGREAKFLSVLWRMTEGCG